MHPYVRRAALALLVWNAVLFVLWWRAALAPLRRPDLGDPPARSSTVRTRDGIDLHVEEDGDPDAPLTVLFVHGFTARLGEFALQREALRSRARLVFYDHRGHGRSGWRSRWALRPGASIEQLAEDLEAVLEHAAPRGPVVLVGHSLGGMVVMALAGRRPDLFGPRVVGAFLLGTSAGDVVSTGPAGWSVRLLRRLHLLEVSLPLIRLWLWLWAPVVERVRRPGTAVGRAWIRHFMFGREKPEPELVTLVQDMLEESPFRISAAFYASFLTHDEIGSLEVLSDVPVVVLVGSHDRLTPASASRRIAAEIGPSAELVVVPGAGHSVNLTRPDVVHAALHRLLDRAEEHVSERRTA